MIGINTLIFSIRGGGNIGIGFAIPANTIRRVASELIREKRIVRPWFGVEGYTLNEDLADALSLPVKTGILRRSRSSRQFGRRRRDSGSKRNRRSL